MKLIQLIESIRKNKKKKKEKEKKYQIEGSITGVYMKTN